VTQDPADWSGPAVPGAGPGHDNAAWARPADDDAVPRPADDTGWARPGSPPAAPPSGPPSAPVPPVGSGYAGWPPPVPTVAPPAGYPYLPAPPLPPRLPPGVPRLRPVRIDPVPGTSFGVAIPALSPTLSGLAVGSTVAGVGAVLVGLVVLCVGISRTSSGALVGGAFAALAAVVGLGAGGAALAGLREIRAAAGQVTGRGLAITGLTCGGTGFGLAAVGMLLAVLLSG